jgi:hypothetical protein
VSLRLLYLMFVQLCGWLVLLGRADRAVLAALIPRRLRGDSPAVGADNAFTSCDLRILVEEAAEPVASPDADVVVGRRDISPAVGWLLAEGPVRPVRVVATRGRTW